MLEGLAMRVLFVIVTIAMWIPPASAQDSKVDNKRRLEFRLFDANEPAEEHDPFPIAAIHYRAKVDGEPDIKFNVEVKRLPDKGNYYIDVEKGWLIDRLVIRVQGAARNPGLITKVVTNNHMTVYPGVSESDAKFKFHQYMAQMGVYRDIYSQFVEEVPAAQQSANRASLKNAFSKQLENMGKLKERLDGPTGEQFTAAQKLANEVLGKYGIPSPEAIPGTYCVPCRRGLFGRRR